jgi:two-component system, cell cycle response regulator
VGVFPLKKAKNESSWIVKGTKCPWKGEEVRRNPILCTLTRKIISNITLKVDSDFRVEALKTIGNRNDCCEFLIKVD